METAITTRVITPEMQLFIDLVRLQMSYADRHVFGRGHVPSWDESNTFHEHNAPLCAMIVEGIGSLAGLDYEKEEVTIKLPDNECLRLRWAGTDPELAELMNSSFLSCQDGYPWNIDEVWQT